MKEVYSLSKKMGDRHTEAVSSKKNVAKYATMAVVFHSAVSLLAQVSKDLYFRVDD